MQVRFLSGAPTKYNAQPGLTGLGIFMEEILMRVIYGNSAFCAGYEARGYLRISDDLKPDIALMVKGEIEPIVIKAKEYESLIVNDTDVTVLYEGPSMSIVPMHRLEEVCLTTKGESIND